MSAKLLGADNVFWTVARQHTYDLELQGYAAPREIAGRVSASLVSGDHIPHVPANESVIAQFGGASGEHTAGATMFATLSRMIAGAGARTHTLSRSHTRTYTHTLASPVSVSTTARGYLQLQ